MAGSAEELKQKPEKLGWQLTPFQNDSKGSVGGTVSNW